jgi:hypothetical protein
MKAKLVRETLNESIEDKDWSRMSDLVLSGKDGAGVAKTITNKKKAINRYVAGLKLKGNKLNYNPAWKQYSRDFSEFGNKALELGATPEEIEKAFDEAEVPSKYAENLGKLENKKLNNRFVGSLSKAILDAGFNIDFLPHSGNAITWEGKEAMQRNGRKWTIGYKTKIDIGGKAVNLTFDAITDEGNGPTFYIIDRSSDNIFNTNPESMSKTKFISVIMNKLNSLV